MVSVESIWCTELWIMLLVFPRMYWFGQQTGLVPLAILSETQDGGLLSPPSSHSCLPHTLPRLLSMPYSVTLHLKQVLSSGYWPSSYLCLKWYAYVSAHWINVIRLRFVCVCVSDCRTLSSHPGFDGWSSGDSRKWLGRSRCPLWESHSAQWRGENRSVLAQARLHCHGQCWRSTGCKLWSGPCISLFEHTWIKKLKYATGSIHLLMYWWAAQCIDLVISSRFCILTDENLAKVLWWNFCFNVNNVKIVLSCSNITCGVHS